MDTGSGGGAPDTPVPASNACPLLLRKRAGQEELLLALWMGGGEITRLMLRQVMRLPFPEGKPLPLTEGLPRCRCPGNKGKRSKLLFCQPVRNKHEGMDVA